MTTRWLIALALLAACGSPPIAVAPVRPTPPVAKHVHPHAPWSWLASNSKPWRLPEDASDVLIASADRALVRTYAGALIELSLATGIATAPVEPAGDTGVISSMVRTGARILAFGRHAQSQMAWEITFDPLAAHPIALPDPVPEPPGELSRPNAVLDPDGKRILLCSPQRWPTVRDAATLAVIQVFRNTKCRRPHFTDRDHVVFNDDKTPLEGDLVTGTVRAVPATAVVYAGPAGRKLLSVRGSQRLVDASGALLYESTDGNLVGQVKWTPDGRAINLGLAQLAIRPAPPGFVDVTLPFDFNHFDVDDAIALVVQGQTAIAIDLRTGELREPEGNVGSVDHIAPKDGTVYVLTDRLRMYRDAALTGIGEASILGFDVGSRLAPVITTGTKEVALWNPATNSRRVLFPITLLGSIIAHAGSTIVFDDLDQLYRSVDGAQPMRWAHWQSGVSLDAIDVAGGRVVLGLGDANHIVDLEGATLASFAVPDFGGACGHASKTRFTPSGGIVVEAAGQLHLRDGWGNWIAGIDLQSLLLSAWEILPTTGEVVIAGPSQIAIWNPDGNHVIGWKPPTDQPPVQLGVSDNGRELAVGYGDGSVLWADLRELRTNAVPFEAEPVAADLCPQPPAAVKLTDLLIDP